MIDVVWQVTAMASIVAGSALGVYARRALTRLDERRDERRAR